VPPWHPDPLTGYPYYKDINITLQNVGTRNIGGVTLDVKLEGNTTNIYLGIHVTTTQLGVFHIEESKSLLVRLITAKEQRQALEDCRLRLTLMLDKNVLDRQTITIGD
jgi:hypothetical protein